MLDGGACSGVNRDTKSGQITMSSDILSPICMIVMTILQIVHSICELADRLNKKRWQESSCHLFTGGERFIFFYILLCYVTLLLNRFLEQVCDQGNEVWNVYAASEVVTRDTPASRFRVSVLLFVLLSAVLLQGKLYPVIRPIMLCNFVTWFVLWMDLLFT